MKILLVDYTHEADREFNDPTREKLENIADCEVWSPEKILSASTIQEFGALVIGGVPDNIERYPFKLTQGDIAPIKEARIPVLGICLGHQLIGQNFEAQLKIGEERECGLITVSQTSEGLKDELFHGIPNNFEARTMHQGSISLPEGFVLLASSEECANQAMVDSSGLLRGVQFHPEYSGEVGDAIFYNLARIASNHTQLANTE